MRINKSHSLSRACSDDYPKLGIYALEAARALVIGAKTNCQIDDRCYVVSACYVGSSQLKGLNINDQRVGLVWLPWPGGLRCLFLCPVCSCRAKMLYDRGRLQCVRCARLYYRTKRSSSPSTRGPRHALRKLRRLRAKLGWSQDDPALLPGPRPKWMRWTTFARLSMEHLRARARWLEGFQNSAGRPKAR
jgi:hypothetical protein